MDGIEAAHIIKQRFPSYADVPIIALTANAAVDAREMFLREGMSDFIAKPISLRTIKFLDEYKAMKNVLSAYFGNKDNEKPEKQDIKPQLDELSNALSDMDALQIDDVLEKISQNTSASDKTYFDGIKTAVDDCDFDKAESILSEWNSTLQS